MLLLSGRKVQRSPLYRLLPRTGLPWTCPGCTGLPLISCSAIEKRYREARWSTCAGLQLSCLTSYWRAEKTKMVSKPTSSPIYGLRPRIRGRSVISTEPGLYWHLCRGRSMYWKGAGGGFAQVALMGGGGGGRSIAMVLLTPASERGP